jgi:hypothetical protein
MQDMRTAAADGVSPYSMSQLADQLAIEQRSNHQYRVDWIIDLTAKDHIEAAREAKASQLDPDTMANVFDVTDLDTGTTLRIDLDEED